MKEIVIQIPTLEAEQNIEIDVKINGRKRTMQYRVEIVSWETGGNGTPDRVSILQRVIKEYDKAWELIQIGAPIRDSIPVMFRRKSQRINET